MHADRSSLSRSQMCMLCPIMHGHPFPRRGTDPAAAADVMVAQLDSFSGRPASFSGQKLSLKLVRTTWLLLTTIGVISACAGMGAAAATSAAVGPTSAAARQAACCGGVHAAAAGGGG